ncbi:MAG: phosphotransferase family protein [Alphaproteobacteria bacterium]|nr:MAG: phosphotransferase family protein [Alphaproteobacteria bacterium]
MVSLPRTAPPGATQLSGGALHRHCRLASPEGALVLRRTGSRVLDSLSRAAEFHLQSLAWAAGVPTPEPLAAGPDWVLMRHHPGSAEPAVAFGADLDALTDQAALCLAQIHRLTPAEAACLPLVPPPVVDSAAATVAALRAALDARHEAHPALELALAQLGQALPPIVPPVLCHGDFRVGNLLIEDGRLEVVLDWEFAGWRDPAADIGWMRVAHWRRGRAALQACGLAPMDQFLARYAAHGGREPCVARQLWWRLAGVVRWAVIALAQADRFAAGEDTSLARAKTGRLLPRIEVEALAVAARLLPGRAEGTVAPPPPWRCVGEQPSSAAIRKAGYPWPVDDPPEQPVPVPVWLDLTRAARENRLTASQVELLHSTLQARVARLDAQETFT